MQAKNVYDAVTISLCTGCIVCGCLVIYYATQAQQTYTRLEGTLVSTEKSDEYRLLVDGTAARTPTFGLKPGMDGERFEVWVHMPACYLQKPVGNPPEATVKMLQFCIGGIGVALMLQLIARAVHKREKHQSARLAIFLNGAFGLANAVLGFQLAQASKDALEYEQVKGIVEATKDGRITQVGLENVTSSNHVIGTTVQAPTVGQSVTVYRVKAAPVRASSPFPEVVGRFFWAVGVIVMGLICIAVIVMDWRKRGDGKVHPLQEDTFAALPQEPKEDEIKISDIRMTPRTARRSSLES